jgi:IS605 OrfB family transposase
MLFDDFERGTTDTKYESHWVSKQIVDCAASHCRCLVVGKLEGMRKKGSKIRSCVEKSHWSFYELMQFIFYQAALRAVMGIEVDPAYTSQECSRMDHRDANAAFPLAQRVVPIGRVARESESPRSALLLVEPFPGTEAQPCA